MEAGFNNSVFINCPFDEQYVPLLRPLLFTIRYLGFFPRIATESLDSGRPRIGKILNLIEACRLSVHDLSRIKAEKSGDYFRFNMPFELGLDIGCRSYKGGRWKDKKCLILEKERYRYQVALSDLSNSDIASHGDQAGRLVRQVRNWLVNEELKTGPSGTEIWFAYNEFWGYLRTVLISRQFAQDEIDELPIMEFLHHLDEWLMLQ